MQDKIAIITDSCADVPRQMQERYNIFILPMVITCEDGEYRDGVDITVQEVYQKIKNEVPKTSSPRGEDVLNLFEEVKAQGYNKAVMIMLSGGLSGTVGYMKMMADQQSEIEIEVYDSFEASIGSGAIAIQAAKYADEGMNFLTLKQEIDKLIANTKVFFSIDTLELLVKGGRIGKAAGFIGTVLNIKPILSFDSGDGQIYAASKVRGNKAVQKELIKLVSDNADMSRRFNLMVADGGAPEQRDELEAKLREKFPNCVDIFRSNIGGALSVHLGDRLLGAGIQYLD